MADRVVIVDYGMGNIWSVRSALCYLGVEPIVSSDPATVASADTLILPGVGSFRKAMEGLKTKRLSDALADAVLGRRRKIMGICLGMQLFAQRGTEDGLCDGLGFFAGSVDRFAPEEVGALKVPHIGFNHVTAPMQSQLFKGLSPHADFYFVHSYRLLAAKLSGQKALCRYGVEFLAAYEHENIFATQFHPEKSQTNGLKLLSNFIKA
jgi:glutamine amidotransferase